MRSCIYCDWMDLKWVFCPKFVGTEAPFKNRHNSFLDKTKPILIAHIEEYLQQFLFLIAIWKKKAT